MLSTVPSPDVTITSGVEVLQVMTKQSKYFAKLYQAQALEAKLNTLDPQWFESPLLWTNIKKILTINLEVTENIIVQHPDVDVDKMASHLFLMLLTMQGVISVVNSPTILEEILGRDHHYEILKKLTSLLVSGEGKFLAQVPPERLYGMLTCNPNFGDLINQIIECIVKYCPHKLNGLFSYRTKKTLTKEVIYKNQLKLVQCKLELMEAACDRALAQYYLCDDTKALTLFKTLCLQQFFQFQNCVFQFGLKKNQAYFYEVKNCCEQTLRLLLNAKDPRIMLQTVPDLMPFSEATYTNFLKSFTQQLIAMAYFLCGVFVTKYSFKSMANAEAHDKMIVFLFKAHWTFLHWTAKSQEFSYDALEKISRKSIAPSEQYFHFFDQATEKNLLFVNQLTFLRQLISDASPLFVSLYISFFIKSGLDVSYETHQQKNVVKYLQLLVGIFSDYVLFRHTNDDPLKKEFITLLRQLVFVEEEASKLIAFLQLKQADYDYGHYLLTLLKKCLANIEKNKPLNPKLIDNLRFFLEIAQVQFGYQVYTSPGFNWLTTFHPDAKCEVDQTNKTLVITLQKDNEANLLEQLLLQMPIHFVRDQNTFHLPMLVKNDKKINFSLLESNYKKECQRQKKQQEPKQSTEKPRIKAQPVLLCESTVEEKSQKPFIRKEKSAKNATESILAKLAEKQEERRKKKSSQRVVPTKKQSAISEMGKNTNNKAEIKDDDNNNNNNNNSNNNQTVALIVRKQPTTKWISKADNEIAIKYALPISSYLNLMSAYQETENPSGYGIDNVTLRYFVLYHAIRLIQSLIDNRQIDHRTKFYTELRTLRPLFVDKMEQFLNSAETDPDFFSDNYYSLIREVIRLYNQAEDLLALKPVRAHTLDKNPIYQAHCLQQKLQTVPASQKTETLFTVMVDRLKNRLDLIISGVAQAHELAEDPFKEGYVKMLLAEIGQLARTLRDHARQDCQELILHNLQFAAYRAELFAELEAILPWPDKRKPNTLLPYLKSFDSTQLQTFLQNLTLGECLTLCIEIRNIIARDTQQDYLDYPEEISSHFAFDMAMHLMHVCLPKLMCVLDTISPQPTLNVNANTIVPQFLPMIQPYSFYAMGGLPLFNPPPQYSLYFPQHEFMPPKMDKP